RVGKRPTISLNHALGQIFQIDLVANPHAWRNHSEIVECILSPFQNLVSFFIPIVFIFHVAGISVGRSEKIHLDAMIDHKIYGNCRTDLATILPFTDYLGPYRGDVHYSRYTS